MGEIRKRFEYLGILVANVIFIWLCNNWALDQTEYESFLKVYLPKSSSYPIC